MEKLKAGSVIDIADSMTEMIELAMHEEWARVYPKDSLPDELGRQDRLVLFAAVAKGVLRYLYKHRASIETTPFRFEGEGFFEHKHELDFDLVEKEPGS
jgi:hypothetical protein